MANTRYLTRAVEDWVRDRLSERYGQTFEKKVLRLVTGRDFEFDAVSADATIVAAVKTSSGITSGGNFPSGKVNSCIADLWYLGLISAPRRLLVLTSPDFYDLFTRRMAGAIPDDIEVIAEPLPADMQKNVDRIVALASAEMGAPAVDEALATAIEDNVEHHR